MASISPPRWYAKKAARWAMGAATGLAPAFFRPEAAPVLRVLTYHAFGFERRDPFCLDPASFEQQVRWLAEQGRAVTLSAVRDFVGGNGVVRDGSVLVTIDDGDAGVGRHAWPILRRYGVPAVAFVIAGEL